MREIFDLRSGPFTLMIMSRKSDVEAMGQFVTPRRIPGALNRLAKLPPTELKTFRLNMGFQEQSLDSEEIAKRLQLAGEDVRVMLESAFDVVVRNKSPEAPDWERNTNKEE